ncbi:MAG: alpha/beta fold hydrolase [Gaiellaceae bacterium]
MAGRSDESRREAGTLVLVHGAGSGPWIFESWRSCFEGWRLELVDLQAGLGVAEASMADYAAVIERATEGVPRPLVLAGWSLGGLAVLMAVEATRPDLVGVLEPSPPAEIQGPDPGVPLVPGTFDPQVAYGPFPESVPARPESTVARAERKRGISVSTLSCPSVVVYGKEFPADRGRTVAALYGSEALAFPDLDHWALVLDRRVPEALASTVARLSG